ncbi:MAG: TraR/DksA C4-type zinc finger protein [Acidimicrobiales bacterium]
MTIDQDIARELLDEERQRLETARGGVDADLAEERLGASEELADYDQHPAEQGTEVAAIEQDLGLREDFATRLQENDEARRRVDNGRYGTCETCGKPISDDRLRALPSTRHCIEHARAGSGT